MADIITMISSVFTAMTGWVGDIITMVEDNPLLLFGLILSIVIGLISFGIKLIKRR